MSAITNNISYHQAHGDAPAPTHSVVVLSNFSITLHNRWKNPTPIAIPNIVKAFSICIHKRWNDGEKIDKKTVLRKMNAGYYGWKYLSETIAQQPQKLPQGSITHHK